MRLEDFRSTIAEIVDAEHHGIAPRDFREHDSESYGKRVESKEPHVSSVASKSTDFTPGSERPFKQMLG